MPQPSSERTTSSSLTGAAAQSALPHSSTAHASSSAHFSRVDRITPTFRPRASQLKRRAGAARHRSSGGALEVRADVARSGATSVPFLALWRRCSAPAWARRWPAPARPPAAVRAMRRRLRRLAPLRFPVPASGRHCRRHSCRRCAAMRTRRTRCGASLRGAPARAALRAPCAAHTAGRTSALPIGSGVQPAARLALVAARYARFGRPEAAPCSRGADRCHACPRPQG